MADDVGDDGYAIERLWTSTHGMVIFAGLRMQMGVVLWTAKSGSTDDCVPPRCVPRSVAVQTRTVTRAYV